MKTNYSELISIIVPTFNEELYIAKCLNSLLNQTYNNIEIIIVDDNSTDDTCEIIKTFITQDKRIKLIRKNINEGPAICLNIGIKAAKSARFIARMDADDFVFPTRIEKQYYFMENNYNVVACGTAAYYLNYRNSEFRLSIFPCDDNDIRKLLSIADLIQSGAAMYRREALEKVGYFDELNPKAEAMRLLLKLSEIGELGNISSPEYVYITREGNSNRSADANYKKRNIAYSQITKNYAYKKKKIRAYFAHIGWHFYDKIPRFFQIKIRNFFSNILNINLSTKEINWIENYYKNL